MSWGTAGALRVGTHLVDLGVCSVPSRELRTVQAWECLWVRLGLSKVLVHVLLCFASLLTGAGPTCVPDLQSDGGGELPGS